MTLRRKSTLNFGHSQTHDLMRVKAMWVGLSIGLAASGLGLSLFVMHGFIPGVMALSHI